jgi:hypothetical protein
MPLFRLQENRYLSTDHIAEISYTDAGAFSGIQISFVDSAGNQTGTGPELPPSPSSLDIILTTTEKIRVEGEEADNAWAGFKAVHEGCETTSSVK